MFAFISRDELIAAAGRVHARADINARYQAAESNSSAEWEAIREAWSLQMDSLVAGKRVDGYFLNWKFASPIERNAWNDIRSIGLPLYPQCPVGGVFIDFADPHLKIGLELDGQAFHDKARDTLRDERLWSLGWRIFRITGAESFRVRLGPLDAEYADESVSDYERAALLDDWAMNTVEGVIWSLGLLYYNRRKSYRPNAHDDYTARSTLVHHRLVNFPLSLSDEADE